MLLKYFTETGAYELPKVAKEHVTDVRAIKTINPCVELDVARSPDTNNLQT